MKGTIVWGIAAAVLAVTGVVCLRIATVERLVADAQQDLATLNYARAERSLAEAETSIGLARYVPGFHFVTFGLLGLNLVGAGQVALLAGVENREEAEHDEADHRAGNEQLGQREAALRAGDVQIHGQLLGATTANTSTVRVWLTSPVLVTGR